MRRRQLITLVGAGIAASPLAVRAQQRSTMPLVGILHLGPPNPNGIGFSAIRKGFAETGFIEGRNLTIEYRWAAGDASRLTDLAADLVRRQVGVIVTGGGTPANLAAKAATTSIPIVFASGDDPVAAGLVTSLNRPGGNITGVSDFVDELMTKRVELLHEVAPTAKVFGMLVDAANPESQAQEAQRATVAFGLELHVLGTGTSSDVETAFATLKQRGAGALIIGASSFFINRSDQLVALAAQYAIPVSYYRREFVVEGGLMSYGASLVDNYRQAGVYAGRILKGEKPADLPVLQPTRFEFVLNLKTAKALNLDIPLKLHAFADEVIE